MQECPSCKSEDIDIESNPSLQVTVVYCSSCSFGFQAPVTEECMEKMLSQVEQCDCADFS